jgi:hypothetical protein
VCIGNDLDRQNSNRIEMVDKRGNIDYIMNDYIVSELCEIEEKIFNNEVKFINQFTKGECTDLIEVYFSSENVLIVYLLEEGATIIDYITIPQLNDFLLSI